MKVRTFTYLISILFAFVQTAVAQEVLAKSAADSMATGVAASVSVHENEPDLISVVDSATVLVSEVNDFHIAQADSSMVISADSIANTLTVQKKRWIPDPKKAMWWAIAFPGLGQIYNRKYWKLPIIYGGLLGCFYALNWNGNMYRDYSQAFSDIMDSNPETKSYENFLPASYNVADRMDYLQGLFKRKKDFYRRYRDLSIFCMIGVYLLAVVDAYVDAELSSFDITRDLTMKVQPTIINDGNRLFSGTALRGNSYGFQCSLNF